MSDTPQTGPFSVSERLRAAQTIAGTSRHYQGPGLGIPPAWTCASCERQWTSEPADGCPVCVAEARVALDKKKAEEFLEKPIFLTGMRVEPAAPTNENARRALSPLLAPKSLDMDRLADLVAQRVVAQLSQLAGAPPSAPDGAVFLPPPAGLYAILIGLQLVAQAQADGAVDPLLPPTEATHQLIHEVEALPTLQQYVLDPGPAPGVAPIPVPTPEEPEA